MAKKMSPVTWVVIIAVALIVNAQMGWVDLGGLVGGDKDDGSDDGGSQAGGITYTTPTLSFDCVDLHSPQTGVSCGAQYRINGGVVAYDSDGASLSISAGDEVEYVVNASNYYAEHGTLTMPAKNLHRVPVRLLNWDTSPSWKVYMEDDGLLNSATATEGLPANAVDDIEIQIISSYKDGIKGATLVLDYVRTNIDDVTADIGSDVAEPDSLTHNTTAGRGSADTFASFLLGDLNADASKNKETKTVFLTIDVGATTYGTTNMTLGLIDKDWYKDINGGFSYGYEEPDANTDQGQAHHKFDTLFFTAAS